MHAVLEHIDRHLDRTIPLKELARVAHFSPFHFHRVFTAWSGEAVGVYVRRRRLEIAASRLRAQPDLRVLSVALAVGFASAEAFARAFRARFGRSPTAWRESNAGLPDRKMGQVNRDSLMDDRRASQPSWESSMHVQLIDRPSAEVAYLRHTGAYGAPLSTFWQQTVYPWMVTNNLLGVPRYGISLDDPAVTKPEACRYDACVAVAKGVTLTGRAMRKAIPGGRYAALRFRGTSRDIETAWQSLLGEWLPSSGLQLDARPIFEHYRVDARYDPSTGIFECELCAPVSAL
jgi:AraC family transcriptional regulator